MNTQDRLYQLVCALACERSPWLASLSLIGACTAQPVLPGAGGEEMVELGEKSAALCLTGPAFPTCRGHCGFLACSPIDPGACCSCDEGCSARDDCCCDYAAACTCPGGSTPRRDERVSAVAVGPSGELYVVGTRAPLGRFSSDIEDGFLRRLHPTTLATLWDRAIDDCHWDNISDLTVLPGGDIVVVGSTRPGAFATTPARLAVRRYTKDGYKLWQASPETPLGHVTGASVARDPVDGSLVITGALTTATDLTVLLARIRSDGTTSLITSVPGFSASVGRAVAVAPDGSIAILTAGGGAQPARLIALTRAGEVRWSAEEGTGSEGADVGFDASGFAVAASSLRSASSNLAQLSRYDPRGALSFRRSLDLGVRHVNPVAGLVVTASGEGIVSGEQTAFDGTRAWLARLKPTGVVRWSRVLAAPFVASVNGVAVSAAAAFIAAQQAGVEGNETRVLREAL